jgi:hypothetical protein
LANRIKSDGPTKKIVKALREVGASVEYFKARTGRGNRGRPDLLVGFNGRNFLLEVKDPGSGRLSEDQVLFHSNWQGAKIEVVTSETEALIAIGLVV